MKTIFNSTEGHTMCKDGQPCNDIAATYYHDNRDEIEKAYVIAAKEHPLLGKLLRSLEANGNHSAAKQINGIAEDFYKRGIVDLIRNGVEVRDVDPVKSELQDVLSVLEEVLKVKPTEIKTAHEFDDVNEIDIPKAEPGYVMDRAELHHTPSGRKLTIDLKGMTEDEARAAIARGQRELTGE